MHASNYYFTYQIYGENECPSEFSTYYGAAEAAQEKVDELYTGFVDVLVRCYYFDFGTESSTVVDTYLIPMEKDPTFDWADEHRLTLKDVL
jgi:hypothetical protein